MYAQNVQGQHRDRLRAAGFSFSDESEQKLDPTLRQAGATLGEATHAHSAPSGILCPLHNLLRKGVTASTCDHDVQQNIGNTVSDDDDFWSSTASGPNQEEHLLYRLASPRSQVYGVQVAVYRARYQLGAPLYPPHSISFEVGFSQNHMQPIPGRYQVQLTDRMQTFQLPVSTSIGHFLKIILHGKVQQQFEDRQYHTAIRCVKVIGHCLPAAAMYDASQLVHNGQLYLTEVLNMPATICQRLQSMTVHSRVAASETAAVADSVKDIARLYDEPDVRDITYLSRKARLPMQSKTTRGACFGSTGTETSPTHFLQCSNTSGIVYCDQTHSM